jgi:pyruvate dehydrogenase phosphatase
MLMGRIPGHGGEHTAEHAITTIPSDLRQRLFTALSSADLASIDLGTVVPTVIQAALTAFEDGILGDLFALFPGGLGALEKMSEDEVKAIINDSDRGAVNSTKVLRCMRGCTALITLVDPTKENVWVASLGDCQASTLPHQILWSGNRI